MNYIELHKSKYSNSQVLILGSGFVMSSIMILFFFFTSYSLYVHLSSSQHIVNPLRWGHFFFWFSFLFISFLVFFSLLLASLFLLLATLRKRCSWAAKDMIESERKRPMGEPFLGSQRGLGMSYFWVARWDRKQEEKAADEELFQKEGTQPFEKEGDN